MDGLWITLVCKPPEAQYLTLESDAEQVMAHASHVSLATCLIRQALLYITFLVYIFILPLFFLLCSDLKDYSIRLSGKGFKVLPFHHR